MKSFILAILLFAVFTALCGAAPDDARLSKLILGEWRWGRYAIVEYMGNGTYTINYMDEITSGKWHIKKRQLIEIYRNKGESKESSTVYDIRVLDNDNLVIFDEPQQALLTHHRIHQIE